MYFSPAPSKNLQKEERKKGRREETEAKDEEENVKEKERDGKREAGGWEGGRTILPTLSACTGACACDLKNRQQ